MEPSRTEQVVQQLRELYRRYGYTQYKMSKFEPYDLYVHNKSFLVSEDILTFTDADGRLMALKPDVTLSIVKNVYRTSPMTRGFREIMQTGLECVGEIDLVAMGEVLLLAAKSLETISGDYLLDVSHLGFVAGLLDSAQVAEECRAGLLKHMEEKNVPALGAYCRELGLDPEASEDLCQLTALYGPPAQMLPVLEEMVRGERMELALAELRDVCSLLPERHLRLDFSIVNNMDYYNGFIFRGYLPGLPSGVLSGGQYDNLLRQMGRKDGAIGFEPAGAAGGDAGALRRRHAAALRRQNSRPRRAGGGGALPPGGPERPGGAPEAGGAVLPGGTEGGVRADDEYRPA